MDPILADELAALIAAAATPMAIRHEGLRLNPYHDPVGFPTIGYGHLLSREVGADLSKWPSISKEEAIDLLCSDLMKAAKAVLRLVPVPLTIEQQAALADFAFNLGAGNLQASTLRQMILRGDLEGAAGQFCRWVHARGVRLPGLVKRRADERKMFIGE